MPCAHSAVGSVGAGLGLPYGTQVQIEPGAQLRRTHTVTDADTAVAMESGEVAVLATSRLLAWCERATLEAMNCGSGCDPDLTSVALRVHIDHLRPVLPGCQVEVLATLERIEGRRFVFVVSVLEVDSEVLAAGRIVRVQVKTEEFMASACGQSG